MEVVPIKPQEIGGNKGGLNERLIVDKICILWSFNGGS